MFIFAGPILFGSQEVEIKWSQSTMKQGETIRVDIKTLSPLQQGTLYLDKGKYTIFGVSYRAKEYRYVSYVGISRKLKPGHYTVRTDLLYMNGARYTQKKDINIASGKFKRQNIQLSGKKKSFPDRTNILSKENYYILKAFRIINRKKLSFN